MGFSSVSLCCSSVFACLFFSYFFPSQCSSSSRSSSLYEDSWCISIRTQGAFWWRPHPSVSCYCYMQMHHRAKWENLEAGVAFTNRPKGRKCTVILDDNSTVSMCGSKVLGLAGAKGTILLVNDGFGWRRGCGREQSAVSKMFCGVGLWKWMPQLPPHPRVCVCLCLLVCVPF